MKGSIVAIVAVAASVASAQFKGVPECAQACLTSAIAAVGCPAGDVGCQCSSTAAIAGAGGLCIAGACTGALLQSAINGGNALCVAYLATVSASATGSAELTTTLKSTTTATSTVTVNTSSIPAPTGMGNGTTTTTLMGTGGGVTAKPTSTKTGASTATSATVPPNAGVKMGVGLGGVGALFMAFFAL